MQPTTDNPPIEVPSAAQAADGVPVRWQGHPEATGAESAPGSPAPLRRVATLRVERLRLGTVVRVAAFVNLGLVAVATAAAAALWVMARLLGTVAEAESLLASATGNESFAIDGATMLTWFVGVALVVGVLATAAVVVVAALMNALSVFGGGVEAELRRIDTPG